MNSAFLFSEPPFESCHAASLAQTPAGLRAVWFGGSREGAPDVEIWLSCWEKAGWTHPESVAAGLEEDQRYPCWNPVLFQAPNGRLLLFYKVGPSPRAWWGMLSQSEDDGQTWTQASRLPQGFLGPVKNKPVLLAGGVLVCPSSSEHDGWRPHIEQTSDLGQTWTRSTVPGEIEAIQPTILKHPDDVLQLLARSRSSQIVTSWSRDKGRTWSVLEKIDLPNPNSGIDAVTLADGRHLLVYNHSSMTQDRRNGPRTPLNLAVSEDGLNWAPGPVLESEPGEYSYPAAIQADDGIVHILYTWQRLNIRHVWFDPSELGA